MNLTPEEEHEVMMRRLMDLAQEIPGVMVQTGVVCGVVSPHAPQDRPDFMLPQCTLLRRHPGEHEYR